jgi:ankyrin repeat protein
MGRVNLSAIKKVVLRGDMLYPDLIVLAAEDGNIPAVEFLVDHGSDVNRADTYGVTPLMKAARDGHIDVMRFLIGLGADVDAVDKRGKKVLWHAVRGGSLDCVQLLLDNYASTHVLYPDMLFDAVKNGHTAILKFLLDLGFPVDWKKVSGVTPLMLAARYDRVDCMRILISYNANVNEVDRMSRSVMMHLLGEGNFEGGYSKIISEDCMECIRILLDNGVCEAEVHLMTFQYAKRGENDGLYFFLRCGHDPDWTDDDLHTTLLGVAAWWGNAETMRVLIDFGADVNATDARGRSVMRLAMEGGSLECIEVLAEHNAEIEYLILGDFMMMNLFADRWYDFNWADTGVAISSLLVVAAMLNRVETMLELIADGADVNARNNYDMSAFATAVQYGHLDCVIMLLENNALVDDSDLDAATPEIRAAITQYLMATVIQKHWRRYMVFKRTTDPGHPWGRALLQARARRYILEGNGL